VGDSVHLPLPGVGTLISDRYRLDELAGTGGMAQVWAATDTVLNRRVAVKILHQHLRADPGVVERFRNEARSAARLHHHAVVSVYDTVSSDDPDTTIGVEAIVMELVEGETLRTRLDRVGRMRPDEVVAIGLEVAGALGAAHEVGLTHRDIKPGNILLCAGGGVKVADFGIAKSEADSDLTRDGTLVGTAGYLSPEQVEGEVVDGRADEFALAVVLYEMLTGLMPFTGDTETARALARLHQVPVRPDDVVGGIPPTLAEVVMRSMSRRPDARYTTMTEFGAALGRSLDPVPRPVASGRVPTVPYVPGHTTAPVPAVTTPTTGELAPARRRRDRRWFGTFVLVLLIGGALLLIAALVDGGDTPRPTESANTPSGDLVLVPITDVTPFDPEGSGTPGENDEQRGRAHDGSVETEWRSERYEQRDFGVKSGVGLLVRLDRSVPIERVEIDSPTTNWSAEVHVLDSASTPVAAPSGAGDGTLSGTADGGTSSTTVDGQGDLVLVWFTDLGGGPVNYRMDVGEVRVIGRI
jgi:tRNA A-37 threonylcarbamoyl transferase component Bud32